MSTEPAQGNHYFILANRYTNFPTILSNGTYRLKAGIKKTEAKVLVIVGEKEIAVERKSAEILCRTIPNSQLYVAPKMKHGELSLSYPKQYVEQLRLLFSK